MKFLLVALFATVVCLASGEPLLLDLLTNGKELKSAHGIIGKIICRVDAITDTVKGTDLEKSWKVVADDSKKVAVKTAKCIALNTHNPIKAAKCVYDETTKVRKATKDFIENLKGKSNRSEIYNKIKEAIKNC